MGGTMFDDCPARYYLRTELAPGLALRPDDRLITQGPQPAEYYFNTSSAIKNASQSVSRSRSRFGQLPHKWHPGLTIQERNSSLYLLRLSSGGATHSRHAPTRW